MKKTITGICMLMTVAYAKAFCGFYVAKAGAALYNNKSEVIMVRDGRITTLTMSNDFKGDVKDFAMVVPVPEVLRQRDIKLVNRSIFDKIDAYSAPRLVEYYDESPCGVAVYGNKKIMAAPSSRMEEDATEKLKDKATGVTIQARYTVGEYDITILSAEQSSGLESWLKANGYSIPDNAREVLQPYINDKLNFFVVKVNLEQQKQTGFNYLRPIQITYESDRFMLPIRLGMANARQYQDLLVYTFTKRGRIECTNYRTVKMPTGNNIPTFALTGFDSFYRKTFDREYINNDRNTVFLEYAWNVTPTFNGMKCDPCVGNPPMTAEFNEAGVNWLANAPGAAVFFTRLHIRYRRNEFPQDLMFQETPNTENYQARYIITHPATYTNCSEGEKYLQKLETRKMLEVMEYCHLTGDRPEQYAWYAPQLKHSAKQEIHQKGKQPENKPAEIGDDSIKDESEGMIIPSDDIGGDDTIHNNTSYRPLLLLLMPLILLLAAWGSKIKSKKYLNNLNADNKV